MQAEGCPHRHGTACERVWQPMRREGGCRWSQEGGGEADYGEDRLGVMGYSLEPESEGLEHGEREPHLTSPIPGR